MKAVSRRHFICGTASLALLPPIANATCIAPPWRAATAGPPLHTPRDPVGDIIKVVAWQEGVSVADIVGSSRSKPVVRARQRAMYIAKTLTGKSLPDLGRRFGGRDHTTVLYACKKIELQRRMGPHAAAEIMLLTKAGGSSLLLIDSSAARWPHQ